MIFWRARQVDIRQHRKLFKNLWFALKKFPNFRSFSAWKMEVLSHYFFLEWEIDFTSFMHTAFFIISKISIWTWKLSLVSWGPSNISNLGQKSYWNIGFKNKYFMSKECLFVQTTDIIKIPNKGKGYRDHRRTPGSTITSRIVINFPSILCFRCLTEFSEINSQLQ